MGLPLQSNCDPKNPEEHVLWALVNIGETIGAPLLVPEPILRQWSKHLYECGFRHVPDEQRLWYSPPDGAASVWEGAGGHWLTTKPESASTGDIDTVLDAMDDGTRRALLERLQERGI